MLVLVLKDAKKETEYLKNKYLNNIYNN